MQELIARIVSLCARRAVPAIAVWLLASAAAIGFVATHFAIDTDSSHLLPADLPWRQREVEFDKAFPHRSLVIAIVIDARTPELADRAAAALTQRLAGDQAHFTDVWRPDGGPFFEKNGLLYLPLADLQPTLDQLIAAQPMLGPLAADPTLPGLMSTLALLVRGAARADTPSEDFARPFSALADTLEAARDGRIEPLAWRSLMTGRPADPRELRRFVLVNPVLDFSALQPGDEAAAAIRHAAADLGLTPERGVRVRLTGQVRLADEELATVSEGAALSGLVTVVLVSILLWLALRSVRLMVAILVSLFAGLAITGALGLAMVGALNLISIAFAVLFIGLGVDFGIQLAVNYRAHRFDGDDVHAALREAALEVGGPLALAAAATALGFFAFLPTAYRGVAELGLIAGVGMIVAFAACITLLPALVVVLNPHDARAHVGIAALASADAYVQAHCRRIVIACVALAIASAALLPTLDFDFNPLHLRSAKVESMATLLDLAKDPDTTPITLDVLAPDVKAADAIAAQAAKLPEVTRTLTLSSFVPEDQDAKLAAIADAAMLLGPAFGAPVTAAVPGDAQTVAAMSEASRALSDYATASQGVAAAPAKRLAAAISAVAQGDLLMRERAREALIPGLTDMLTQLSRALTPERVTLETLPPELKRDWIAADGRRARVEIHPAGNNMDNAVLERFVDAVRKVAPDVTGAPATIQDSADVIVTAFVQAGLWALLAITILLVVVLRRAQDVLVTLAPLVLSGLITLAICAAARLPLNFANIIALPLLFGIGVAFNIYFVMAWRRGKHTLLGSSLARAVIFSALTTASAFGSLALSSHPGTASMGALLALSLGCTLAAALVFLPALLALSASPAAGAPGTATPRDPGRK